MLSTPLRLRPVLAAALVLALAAPAPRAQLAAATTASPAPAPVTLPAGAVFVENALVAPSSDTLQLVDVDGDGLPELLRRARFTVTWHDHLDGQGTFGPGHAVNPDFGGVEAFAAADFDGDGDVDVALSKPSELRWTANVDGQGTFGPSTFIQFQSQRAFDVLRAADLDSDGDPDIVTCSGFGGLGKIRWNENRTGTGVFDVGADLAVAPPSKDFDDALVADIDGDGDPDILSLANIQLGGNPANPSHVAWIENVTGAAVFSGQQVVATGLDDVSYVQLGDADLDGDLDLFLSASDFLGAGWLENTGAAFGPLQIVPNDSILHFYPLRLGDLDDDGALDIVGNDLGGLVWSRNADGLGGYGEFTAVSPPSASGARGLTVDDLDLDGVDDVLLSRFDGSAAWYTHASPSTWATLGGGAPGAAGVPKLDATGPLTAGSTLQLALADAPADALMLAWVSTTSTPFDALGGTVHAFPPNTQYFRVADAAGDWSQSLTWPAGIPAGADLFLQFLVQDASVPDQITLSNAETATTP